jgi:hypothetical protein
LQARRDLKKLVWWFNVITQDKTRLTNYVYNYSKTITKNVNWSSMISKLLSKYNLRGLWNDHNRIFDMDGRCNNESKCIHDHRQFWKSYLKKHIFKFEEEKWRASMREKDKLRTFRILKTKLRLEKYLLTPSNVQGRKLMTSLRTGTNSLQIELGRWDKKPEADRTCQQCEVKAVENEKHFVTDCSIQRRKIHVIRQDCASN